MLVDISDPGDGPWTVKPLNESPASKFASFAVVRIDGRGDMFGFKDEQEAVAVCAALNGINLEREEDE